MGEVNMILGVKVTRSEDGIMLSQEYYVERFFFLKKRVEWFEVAHVATPFDANSKFMLIQLLSLCMLNWKSIALDKFY